MVTLSTETEHAILAVPSKQPGSVQIINLYALKEPQKYLSSPTVIVQAHDTELACIALSPQGDRLATASGKGTLIRVWDTKSGMQTHELRRGADRAVIYGIHFHKSGLRLAVSSDKSTIHIFRLQAEESAQT